VSKSMNKREIIDELSERAFTTRKQTNAILESLIEIASREAVNGFALPGLCKFELVDRKARKGRNPRTGEEIDIPASKSLKIRPLGRVKHAATAWLSDEALGKDAEQEPGAQSFFIRCPHHERRLEADSSMSGMVAECPYCENSMTVPQPDESEEPDSAEGMDYVYFYCPICQQAIEAPEEDAGNRMHCPTCKAIVIIPATTELSPEMEEMSKKEMLGNTIRIDIP